MTIAENASLQRRNDLLHAELRRLGPFSSIPIPGAVGADLLPALPPSTREALHFSRIERLTVARFLRNLEELDCSQDETGALLGRYVNEIAGPGFIQALKRIADVQ
ncbi:MAG: hypothetical protein M3P24_09485 [Gemmatimonadota bacterium]|nr:hypothetical protein [Gemmatimonadota bacterium]